MTAEKEKTHSVNLCQHFPGLLSTIRGFVFYESDGA
nr:MAG TPA: hypothetical protein [Caudoviricetes sp.]